MPQGRGAVGPGGAHNGFSDNGGIKFQAGLSPQRNCCLSCLQWQCGGPTG